MDANCSVGYSTQSEFSTLPDCSVFLDATKHFKDIIVASACMAFLFKFIILMHNYKHINKKDGPTILLVYWSLLQNIIFALRPLIGLYMEITPGNTLWFAFVVHISQSLIFGLIILFVYIEAYILEHGSFEKATWLTASKHMLILFGVIQFILFILGPIVSYAFKIELYKMYWSSATFVYFVIIPYCSFLGILIYRRLAEFGDRKILSRRVLGAVIAHCLIGFSNGFLSLYCAISNINESLIMDISWTLCIILNGVLFITFSRPKTSSRRIVILDVLGNFRDAEKSTDKTSKQSEKDCSNEEHKT